MSLKVPVQSHEEGRRSTLIIFHDASPLNRNYALVLTASLANEGWCQSEVIMKEEGAAYRPLYDTGSLNRNDTPDANDGRVRVR